MADVVRMLRVLVHHAGRAWGTAPDGRTALLTDRRHLVRGGWVVRLVADDDGASIDLPGAEQGQVVHLRPVHGSVDRLVQHADAARRPWLLVHAGHARDVTGVARGEVAVAVSLGAERLARPSGRPVLPDVTPTPGDALDTLRMVYKELATQHRTLVDVRFKLLALVPAVSALALVGVVSPGGPFAGVPRAVRVGAALLGLVVVVGIRLYDVRNSQLHDDLVSRARVVETALGVERGVYAARRASIAPVQHDTALRLVYGAVVTAWAAAAVVAAVGLTVPG
ncbi:hypothetical protein OMK64_00055 [Cellulomonas fimi]|uniref:hypothetical protein n=1 Tax=Cellulomonas fimi TaxID=1708 RepID=UPI00234D4325|nr:hypothetical protein [Cellulomonas fimi]MDC7119923.1 hypothetical protein [Cellulomonas fimi]